MLHTGCIPYAASLYACGTLSIKKRFLNINLSQSDNALAFMLLRTWVINVMPSASNSSHKACDKYPLSPYKHPVNPFVSALTG